MKNIAFRAWFGDKKYGSMLYSSKLLNNSTRPRASVEATSIDLFFEQVLRYKGKVDVMMFTGLIDAKGSPVYENDILITDDEEIWGVVRWNDDTCSFYLDSYDRYSLDELWAIKPEVYRDIYRTPELLKEMK